MFNTDNRFYQADKLYFRSFSGRLLNLLYPPHPAIRAWWGVVRSMLAAHLARFSSGVKLLFKGLIFKVISVLPRQQVV